MGIMVWFLVAMFIAVIAITIYALKERSKLAKQYLPFLVVIAFVVMPTAAQDQPPSIDAPPIGNVEDSHPLMLQWDYVQLSIHVLTGDISSEQAVIDAKNAAIMGNNSTNGFKFIPINMTVA